MSPKFEITKVALESLALPATDSRVAATIPTWWVNPRKKVKGGLRLTEQGFDCLTKAGIKSYEMKFEEQITFNNELLVWMDQNIDCPFYITNKKINVFSEKIAVQLVLFAGNIAKLHRAQKRFAEKNKLP